MQIATQRYIDRQLTSPTYKASVLSPDISYLMTHFSALYLVTDWTLCSVTDFLVSVRDHPSVCYCMCHICSKLSCCRFNFPFCWAEPWSCHSQFGRLKPQLAGVQHATVLRRVFDLQLRSCLCWFCVTESHRSSQLSRSAEWTSSSKVFHFTLCSQAPCWWVSQVQPD